jgi:hypothetical protein
VTDVAAACEDEDEGNDEGATEAAAMHEAEQTKYLLCVLDSP